MTNIDSDLLRTFVAIAEAGSMTDGAARLFRSQSSASAKIKQLETALGKAVFQRHGRGVVLTDAGNRLLVSARDVLGRLDGAVREIASDQLAGTLNIGLPDDHARIRLARIVGAFSQLHPLVELNVTCAISAEFPEAVRKGWLDLAVYEVETPEPHEELLASDPTCWACSAQRDLTRADPLPVALFDRACWWREVALRSLEDRGRPYRIIYNSQSVAGILAAVEAGVAVGLVGQATITEGLTILGKADGFGKTPASKLVLCTHSRNETAPVKAMKAAIREAFKGMG